MPHAVFVAQPVLNAINIPSLTQTLLRSRVGMQGWVKKLGSVIKSWKRRYLVFDLDTQVCLPACAGRKRGPILSVPFLLVRHPCYAYAHMST